MNTIPEPPLPGYTIYDPVDPFENVAGPFFWRKFDDGTQHFALQAAAKHCNRQDVVHGGLLLTMIDLTFAAQAKEFEGQRLATISLSSEFVSAGRVGSIIGARAEVTRRTRSLCFLRGQVTCGDDVLLNASCIYRMFQKAV